MWAAALCGRARSCPLSRSLSDGASRRRGSRRRGPVAPNALPSALDPLRRRKRADKMTGRWLLTGNIGKRQTTHDVDVDWILSREYIRIHEVSREKNANGPEYEA